MKKTTREVWIDQMLKMALPVFEALATGRLRELMPVEVGNGGKDREEYTHLEAVGRSLAGIGPWLELADGSDGEKGKRAHLRKLVCASLATGADPNSVDFLNFSKGAQPLVDAAFLAQGLLRSWNSVWMSLDRKTQKNIIECLKMTRKQRPMFCNWLLFSAMVEGFLSKAGADWDRMRIDYAIRQHEQWYKGDGVYGDGADFHWDYYNSYVIQPMLYDLVHIEGEVSELWGAFKEPIRKRVQRYASVLERMISPEGTFPPIGRSLSYRFGAFQGLGLVVLKKGLPESLSGGSVRCAMTAVLERLMEAEGTFDSKGWLRIGLCGHQRTLGEAYISTGSLYLCLCGFLPLGLSEREPFWAEPDMAWTSKRIWSGEAVGLDHALDG